MTEGELKKLNRAELLAMLISVTQRCDELEEELQKAYELAESRDINISQSGTLAEAALRINKVLEAADQAGAQYLENLQRMYPMDGSADPESVAAAAASVRLRNGAHAHAMEQEVKMRCANIEQETKKRCIAMVENAKKESQAYWDEAYGRIKRYSELIAQLKASLNNNESKNI